MLREGNAFVQDLSSALAIRAAAPKPGETVLDLCAAPGGKTLSAALRMRGEGRILSFDLSEQKVDLIRENISRCGYGCIVTASENDAAVCREALFNAADLVIADLPCSGLGVIGRKPDIKKNASEEGIRALSRIQKKILQNAVLYVKPGGRLLFSTCTMTEEENEENAAWLLKEFPALRPVDLRAQLPDLHEKMKAVRIDAAESMTEGQLQLLPQDLDSDGFFFSIFEREGV